MNMARTMGCKIWIACQDQIYERIMEVCTKMYGHGKGMWMDERKVKVKIKDGSRQGIIDGSMEDMYGRLVWMELAPSVE